MESKTGPRMDDLIRRYYFTINSAATVSYVNAYREMWDEEGGKLEGEE
jgi:hypothetical protein